MDTKRTQQILVKLLLFSQDNKKILLLKTKHDYWDLPGGHLKFEESPEEGLMREVKEEIKIEVVIKRLSSVHTIILDVTDRPNPEMRHYVVLVFVGETVDPNEVIILNDSDIVDYNWYNVSKILENHSLKILVLTQEQISLALRKATIRANKKFYIKAGELSAYRVVGD